MSPAIHIITEASKGLCFVSESDAPFQPFTLKAGTSLPESIIELCYATNREPVELVSLDHLFRNAIKWYPGASREAVASAERFVSLKKILETNLQDLQVYRIGKTQVEIFIVGQLADGEVGGLRTRAIET